MSYTEDKYIDELEAASSVSDSDTLPILQGGLTKKASFTHLLSYVMQTAKAKAPGVENVVSSATPVADVTAYRIDQYNVTHLATNAVFAAPIGTPTDGQRLIYRIRDDGTPRTLGFHAIHRFSAALAAPTSTTSGETLYLEFIYNKVDGVWDCVRIVDGL